jgi:hypothetical protein
MYKAGNWKIWLISGACAYFFAGICYYLAKFIANSNSAGGMVAMLAFAGSFFLMATRANGSVMEVEHPAAMLICASQIRVLAELKDALAMAYFGENKWSLENLNEQKGVAMFVCRIKEHEKDVVKERICTLLAKTQALSNATALELHYDVMGDKLSRFPALEHCKKTTEYIEKTLSQNF